MALTAVSTPASEGARATLRELPFGARVRSPEYWAWVRYTVFGRFVPALLFGFMGWLQIVHLRTALATIPASGGMAALLPHVVPQALYTLFCVIPVVLYLTRPMPVARDGRLVARAAAFCGTAMQLVVGAFLPAGPLLYRPPGWSGGVATLIALAAYAFAVLSLLYLRRSLSIIPEARRLVAGGPYRVVRHPLYLAEVSAAATLVLTYPALVPVSALAVFVGMQRIRAGFEERLLERTFPEYADYRRRTTARIIPFVL